MCCRTQLRKVSSPGTSTAPSLHMTTLRTLTEMDRTHCTRSARWDMTSSLSDIQIFWISWYQHRIVQYCITSLSSGIMEEKPNLYTHAFMLCLNVFEKSLWEANSEMHAKPCKICAIPIKPAIRVVFFFAFCGLARLSRNLLGISSWLYSMIDSARLYWDITTNPSYSWHTGHTHHSVDSHWSFLPIF